LGCHAYHRKAVAPRSGRPWKGEMSALPIFVRGQRGFPIGPTESMYLSPQTEEMFMKKVRITVLRKASGHDFL